MQGISLIVPLSVRCRFEPNEIAAVRDVLRDRHGEIAFEVILIGDASELPESQDDSVRVLEHAGDAVARCRQGIVAASNDLIVVLDPRRAYPPEAVAEVTDALVNFDSGLAIAIPQAQKGRPWRTISLKTTGLASRLALGTTDVFSGLMAFRRSALADFPTSQPKGSRLVLDLLTWPEISHLDVPVPTRPEDRSPLGLFRINDFRQAKRVLDLRFGTFSRLIQFCMVGASGMVIDLTLYAIFQVVFGRVWPASADHAAHQVTWSLACARSLAILIAMAWNFTLNRRFTFNDSREGSIPRQFATYALGNSLGIVVSFSLSLLLPIYSKFFSDHRLAAAVVGIIVATGISFSISRWVVFGRKKPADQSATPSLPVDQAFCEPATVS